MMKQKKGSWLTDSQNLNSIQTAHKKKLVNLEND